MRALAALAGAGVVGWTAPALAPLIPAVSDGLGVSRRLADGKPAEPAVALTFDDGPHAEGTPAVLRVLDRASAPATFFLVGEQVERHPAVVRDIVAAGHAVAVHGYRHRNLLRLAPPAFTADLDHAIEVISEASGREMTLYRPPYGIFSPAGLALSRRRGLAPWLWSRWGHDWRRSATAARIAAEAAGDLVAGDVILLHDADHYSAPGSWRNTAAALPAILDRIAERELRPVTLG